MSTLMKAIPDRTMAIKVALKPFLDTVQIETAVTLWREKYSNKPTFSLQYFVRECCALFSIEKERSLLLQSLVRELNGQRLNPQENVSHETSMSRAEADAAVQTFHLLFRQLVDSAGLLRGQEIQRYVAAGLPKMTSNKSVLRSLDLWLTGQMPVIEAAVPIDVMTALVNRAYVGLCEFCGPVKADQILHESVVKVAGSAAGKLFSPQRFL
jgi:hypothetical protein